MPDKIRVGIVGATVTTGGSGWGANAHVPALNALPDYTLKAVCTSREETAQASKEKFGAELAFHDINDMAAHPEIDLIAVSVRVPWHYDLVMAGLRANKPVFCEWPLGANLKEAQEMAGLAKERSLNTIVGLQGRSDPTWMYARDLIADGYVGEVLTANMSVMSGAVVERGGGRVWQRERKNGANTLTISGGHSIDAMCYVLGEFAEVQARAVTRIKEWKDTDLNQMVPVDSPDAVTVAGVLATGAEVAFQVAAVPHNPSGTRLEIYGREGSLVITSGSANIGPNALYGARGKDSPAEMQPPDAYRLAPEGTPAGPPRNVAQAYARYADTVATGQASVPDFNDAVVRHRLIDAIERSSAEGRAISLK
ncbi:MAG TPA: Gfo/Idh/MocA family oxidoreductase [Dehalococcoidia bacterium]